MSRCGNIAWTAALLCCLTFLLEGLPKLLYESIHTFDSRPISFYVNGSGCMSRFESEMEPQDAFSKTHIDQVIHCRGIKNTEGLIMIHTRSILPHAEFRVRLSGPEVHIIPFKHLSERLHYGQYRVARPGEYNVEVMMLYTHFNETHIRNSVFMDSKKLISTSPFVVASDHLKFRAMNSMRHGQLTMGFEDTCEEQGRGRRIYGLPVTP